MFVTDRLSWRRTLFNLRRELALVVALSVLVTLCRLRLGWQWLDIGTVPLQIVGVALSIYLAFLNNTAYDRYWEARTLWGRLVNGSRTFARQVLTLITLPEADPDPDAPPPVTQELSDFYREVVYRHLAFVVALRCALRDAEPFDDLAPFLSEIELASLRDEKNAPTSLLHEQAVRLRDARRRGWLPAVHQKTLEETLTELGTVQGGCERIKNTPMPPAYTYFTNTIVIVYCCALPFGLVSVTGWANPLVTFLVSCAFLILNRVGRLISTPFGTEVNDLPLNALSRTIEINLRQRLREHCLPDAIQPDNGVLL